MQFVHPGTTLVAAWLTLLFGTAVHQGGTRFAQSIHGKRRASAIAQQPLQDRAAVIFMSSFAFRMNILQRSCLQMHNDFETLVTASGLRYTTKESGSPFVGMGSSGATLSCIKCGHRKLRTRGAFKRYPSGLMFFCFDCKPQVSS